MDPKPSFLGQSMIDIVFNNRNKSYGAYFLRRTYKQHLLKALTIAIGLFIFGLYTPKMAGALGLFKGKTQIDSLDTAIIVHNLQNVHKKKRVICSMRKTKTVKNIKDRNREIKPTDKPGEAPPTKDEKHDNESRPQKQQGLDSGIFSGDGTEPFDPGYMGVQKIEEKKIVEITTIQPIDFIGGLSAFEKFIQGNLVYPEPELTYEEEGETEITFIVGADGTLENVSVSAPSGNDHFDKEALRLIRLCNKMFRPHRVNGKPVRSVCKTTINFTVFD